MRFKILNWPLMNNNITEEDRTILIQFLSEDRKLTHGKEVEAFEEEWSKWLGVKYSVMVNSGASANLLTMAYLKILYPEGGEVIVPTLTWVSDISSVIQNGFTPVFVDIDPNHLGMSTKGILDAVNKKTVAVFLTHVLGFSALTEELLENLTVPLIEDCCESHGATHQFKKLGTFGKVSNFSFYFAHHMTTIEGGIISTNNEHVYETVRMLRSHGLVRELKNKALKEQWTKKHPDVNSEFIFAYPAYNVRPTELNAVLGRHQLQRLDANNALRQKNFAIFIGNLDPNLYKTDLHASGSVNYAFPLILKNKDSKLAARVERLLTLSRVEFRKGLSGGGNQLRQPYLKHLGYKTDLVKFKDVEHVHFYSWYIGNYPELESMKISKLCELLNHLKT